MRPVRETLENWGKVAWVPILVVASLSLLVGFCNYRLEVSGARPLLEFTNGDVAENAHMLHLDWINVGRTNAWRTRAKLFNFVEPDKRSAQPLGEAEIKGVGGKIYAGYGGQAEFHITADKFPSRLLACITYFDDRQTFYEQAFLLSAQGTSGGVAPLIEETPPNEMSCH
jgi:hypothetical protein